MNEYQISGNPTTSASASFPESNVNAMPLTLTQRDVVTSNASVAPSAQNKQYFFHANEGFINFMRQLSQRIGLKNETVECSDGKMCFITAYWLSVERLSNAIYSIYSEYQLVCLGTNCNK